MAKSKAKAVSKQDSGSSSKSATAKPPPKASFPSFDEAALSNLTEKLEMQLGDTRQCKIVQDERQEEGSRS